MMGRGWNRDSAANGQQDGVDYNPGSRAIVMLVGGDDILTVQIHEGVDAFYREALSRGMEAPLKAHSDFVATSCCGDNGRALVATINAGDTPLPPVEGDEEMVLYTTIENGVTSYYRDAGGILVKLSLEQAAAYYGGITGGWIKTIALGGTLSAIAYSIDTVKAQRYAEKLVK
jgi:hypothetical protein